MTARGQWMVVLGVVAALALGAWAATRLLGDELFPVAVGSRAPAFSAAVIQSTVPPRTGADPAVRTLTDYKGQVVLVNVWATWCGPCREEIPSLQALYRDYAPRGFKIVAVSIDDGAGAAPKVRDFMRGFGVTFDVLHDPVGAIQKTYQTTGVPENFVIGADGVVRKKAYAQDWNGPENRALIARLLDEAGAPAGPRAPGAAPGLMPNDAPNGAPNGAPRGATALR
jgi:thiol-disulfide isomerase/thioredoxin